MGAYFLSGRNPLIASALFRSGIIEQYGSGIGRIRDACSEAGVKFEYRQHNDCTTLVFHRPGSKLADDTFFGPDGIAKDGLSALESQVLSAIDNDGAIVSKDLAAVLGVGERKAQRILKSLGEDGLIVRERNGRSFVWKRRTQ